MKNLIAKNTIPLCVRPKSKVATRALLALLMLGGVSITPMPGLDHSVCAAATQADLAYIQERVETRSAVAQAGGNNVNVGHSNNLLTDLRLIVQVNQAGVGLQHPNIDAVMGILGRVNGNDTINPAQYLGMIDEIDTIVSHGGFVGAAAAVAQPQAQPQAQAQAQQECEDLDGLLKAGLVTIVPAAAGNALEVAVNAQIDADLTAVENAANAAAAGGVIQQRTPVLRAYLDAIAGGNADITNFTATLDGVANVTAGEYLDMIAAVGAVVAGGVVGGGGGGGAAVNAKLQAKLAAAAPGNEIDQEVQRRAAAPQAQQNQNLQIGAPVQVGGQGVGGPQVAQVIVNQQTFDAQIALIEAAIQAQAQGGQVQAVAAPELQRVIAEMQNALVAQGANPDQALTAISDAIANNRQITQAILDAFENAVHANNQAFVNVNDYAFFKQALDASATGVAEIAKRAALAQANQNLQIGGQVVAVNRATFDAEIALIEAAIQAQAQGGQVQAVAAPELQRVIAEMQNALVAQGANPDQALTAISDAIANNRQITQAMLDAFENAVHANNQAFVNVNDYAFFKQALDVSVTGVAEIAKRAVAPQAQQNQNPQVGVGQVVGQGVGAQANAGQVNQNPQGVGQVGGQAPVQQVNVIKIPVETPKVESKTDVQETALEVKTTTPIETIITSQQPYTKEEIKDVAKVLIQTNKATDEIILQTLDRSESIIKDQLAAASKNAPTETVLNDSLKDPILAALMEESPSFQKTLLEINVLKDALAVPKVKLPHGPSPYGRNRVLEDRSIDRKKKEVSRLTKRLLNGLKKKLSNSKKDLNKIRKDLLVIETKVSKGLNPSPRQLKKAQEYLDALGKNKLFQALIQGDESIKKAHAENVRMTTSLRGHLDKALQDKALARKKREGDRKMAAEEAQKRKMNQKKTSDDMIQMLQEAGVLKQQRANNCRAMASKILAMPSSTKAVNLPETEKGQDKERQLAQRLAFALFSAPKYKETDWTNEVAPVVTDWFASLSPSNQSVVDRILRAGGKSQPYGEIQLKKDLKDQNEPSGAKRSPLRDKAVQG